METYLSAYISNGAIISAGTFSRATARHQIIGPNLYSEAKTCRRSGWNVWEPRRKKPSMPYRLQTLVLRRRLLAVLAELLRRELSEYQKNLGGSLP